MTEKNRHINLFKDKPKKTVDNKVFDMMTAAADKTDVNLEKSAEIGKSSDSIHTALMAAGMTPAYGNIADLADATLYALEGEFGEAALSSAAAIPVIGQMVAGRRALKAAKEAGEETVKLYRGIPDWYPGKMVKEGKFVSPQNIKYYGKTYPQPSKKGIFIGMSKDAVEGYSRPVGKFNMQTGKRTKSAILEFEVPKSWFDKKMKKGKFLEKEYLETTERHIFGYWIDGGIPKGFLTKVHKQ